MRRRFDWIGISLLAVGALLLALALWFSWTEQRFAYAAEATPAIVIEAPAGAGDDPNRTYGRVAFHHRGERHVLAMWPGSGSGTLPADAVVGDIQTMLVPPGEPARARTADFGNRYGLKLTLLFFAAILLLAGIVATSFNRPMTANGDTTTRYVAFAFLALGVAIIAIGGVAAWNQKAWFDRSIETLGVAEYRQNRVRVRLTDRQRRTWHAQAPFLPSSLPPGRDYVTVIVRYDPDRPWEIAPGDFSDYSSASLFLILFGLAFSGVPMLGLWIIWRQKRRRERDGPPQRR